MIVAPRGTAFAGGKLKTILQNYEVDCRSDRMRLLYEYGYDEYFMNTVPVASSKGDRIWFVPEGLGIQRAVAEHACRYRK